MKKALVLVLALAMLLSATSALGVTVNKAGIFPIVDEVIEFDVFYEGGEDGAWDTAGSLADVLEKTNIKLNIMPVVSADSLERRNLLLASGDYPELFFCNWISMFMKADVVQFGMKDEIIIPVDGYIEEYATELKRIFEYNPNYITNVTSSDGHIYGVARFSECYHCSAYPKMYIRTDWLNALNLEMPTTLDEYREVLRAFVANDLNGNGEADEVGLMGSVGYNCPVEFQLIGCSFLPFKPDFWLYLDGGEMYFTPEQDEYRNALRYIKEMYDEGLIDPTSFTQTNEQMQQAIRMDPYSIGAYVCDHVAMGVDNNNYEEYKNYQIMMPLVGPSGFQMQPQNSGEGEIKGFHGVITDACEYPEAAFRLLDWRLSEEAMRPASLKDITYKDVPEGTLDIFGNPAAAEIIDYANIPELQALADAYCSIGSGPSADTAEYRASTLIMVDDIYLPQYYEQRIALDTIPLTEYFTDEWLPAQLFVDTSVSEEFYEIQTNLNEFVRKTCVQFIIGDRDIENGWDAYLNELKAFGSERYLEIYKDTYASVSAE